MERFLKLSISILAIFLISSMASAFTRVMELPKTESVYSQAGGAIPSPFAGMTIKEFLSLTPRTYKELTGKRLSLSQKFSLKLAQHKIKKMVKKGKPVELMLVAKDVDTNNFDILGFILGIALGPIGMLIAYLIEGKSSSTFRWALYGAIIWLGIFLLVVLIL